MLRTAIGGGGLLVVDVTTIQNSHLDGNSAEADGAAAVAFGGGVFDAPLPNGMSAVALTLSND